MECRKYEKKGLKIWNKKWNEKNVKINRMKKFIKMME